MKRRWKQSHLDPEEDRRKKNNHFRKPRRMERRKAIMEEKRLRSDKVAAAAACSGSVLRFDSLHATVAALVTCTSRPLQVASSLRTTAPKTRGEPDRVSYLIRRGRSSSSAAYAAWVKMCG